MNIEKILTQLIEIPSITSNTDACEKTITFIADLAKEKGLKTKIFENENVFSLLIAKEIKNEYKVIMNGHTDVVPAEPEAFKPRIEEVEGKKIMFGRGTSDMKGPDVAIIAAMFEVLDEGLDLDVALLFNTDEETGGFKGMKYLTEQTDIKADIVFIPDGGYNWSICTEEKGVFGIKLTAKGISAHGSRTWLGDNALEKLVRTFNRLQTAFKEEWGEATLEDNWKPTLNLGALNGGKVQNKVPDFGEMLLDIRYPGEISVEKIKDILNNSLEKEVTWEIVSSGSALSTDTNNKYVQKWAELIETPVFEKEPGASDGRWLSEKGIDVLLTKPIASKPHIDNEWIDLDDLIIFKDKIKEWLRSI